jgi:hypothetical protein
MNKVSEVYQKLYHYTTWHGVKGILDSQTLWATNYKFLNDYSEIILFREKLIQIILPHVRSAYDKLIINSPALIDKINDHGGITQVIHHDAEVFVNAQYDALGDEIYILSFCGPHEDKNINDNGILSQWRGYGTDGGAAVVFDTKKIEDILTQEANKFEYSIGLISDIIYSNDEQKLDEELPNDLSVLADIVKLFFNQENLNSESAPDVSHAFEPFVHCISRYKHYGFREENEVRIVVMPTIINNEMLELGKSSGYKFKPQKEIKYRNTNDKHIPYIELFNSSDITLPIEKIIIGPHPDKTSRAAELREKLRDTDIEITYSDIPFVC